MKNNVIAITVIFFVGFILWRNYGVVAKGDEVDVTKPKTNEQKELASKIKDTTEGSTVSTSFGLYQYQNKKWIKIKEIWD